MEGTTGYLIGKVLVGIHEVKLDDVMMCFALLVQHPLFLLRSRTAKHEDDPHADLRVVPATGG